MRKQTKQHIIKTIGTSLLFSGFLMFFWAFMKVYHNGSKLMCININKYGEAVFEYYFCWVIMALGIITIIMCFKDLLKELNKEIN